MKYVYLMRTVEYPNQTYVGQTPDVQKRLLAHNAGQFSYTSKFKPWKLIAFLVFAEQQKADEFEKYLKSGSGRAFVSNVCGSGPGGK